MGIRVGIDTGGTFTDLVAVDDDGRCLLREGAVRSRRPRRATVAALAAAGIDRPGEIESSSSERRSASTPSSPAAAPRVLYLTTKGFEDIPYIQRINRKHHYDFHWRKPTPLVRRRDCIGVAERLDEDGRRARAGRCSGARRGARSGRTGRRRRAAVAVCCLFSYLNPEHELRRA